MSAEREKDLIDWRGERAKEIKKVINDLKFDFALISDKRYDLGPYEMIRLINIFATSRRMKRSLESFEKFIKKNRETSGLEYAIKVIRDKNKNKIRATGEK
ncbi:hypothetical protein ES705_26820 [subsurface metagenome]